MPTYSYRCSYCGKEFTAMHTFSEADDDEICPDCKKAAKRVFTAPGIVFRGSGFYVNDSRKETKK